MPLCDYIADGPRWKCQNCGRSTPPLRSPPMRNCIATAAGEPSQTWRTCTLRAPYKQIDGDWFKCGCGSIALWRCSHYDELVTTSNIDTETSELLSELEQEFQGRKCRGCKAADGDDKVSG